MGKIKLVYTPDSNDVWHLFRIESHEIHENVTDIIIRRDYMNNTDILRRINEILITDAVAADRVNFLSVHTPFKNILYSQSGTTENLVERISENEIYKNSY